VENLRKYLCKSDATAKGHMNQILQNIRSTQPALEITAPETEMIQNVIKYMPQHLKPIKYTQISQADSQQRR
jgi:hypothetical protein